MLHAESPVMRNSPTPVAAIANNTTRALQCCSWTGWQTQRSSVDSAAPAEIGASIASVTPIILNRLQRCACSPSADGVSSLFTDPGAACRSRQRVVQVLSPTIRETRMTEITREADLGRVERTVMCDRRPRARPGHSSSIGQSYQLVTASRSAYTQICAPKSSRK